LAWLKAEFGFSDEELRVSGQLHERYLPQCAAMCAKIAGANSDLEALVALTNTVTPEIPQNLQKSAVFGRKMAELFAQELSYSVKSSSLFRVNLIKAQILTSFSSAPLGRAD
jgi:hypothetical protein